MKEHISKNKVWQIIGVSVLCAVLVLGAVLGVVFGMNHSSEDLNVSKDMSERKPDDSFVMETQAEQGISLFMSDASASADGTTTRLITATLSPASAEEYGVSWSVSFKNANSTWATGKNVSDYVTVTPVADDGLKANVNCKKAFGEQIIVTAKANFSDAQATCTVDYKMRVVGGSISFLGENTTAKDIILSWDGASNGVFYCSYGTVGGKPKYRLILNSLEYSDYTVGGTKNVGVKIVHPTNKNLYLIGNSSDERESSLGNSGTFDFPEQDFDENFFNEWEENKSLCVQLYFNKEVIKEWIVSVEVPKFAISVSVDTTSIVF